VIHELDADETSGLDQAAGERDVIRAGSGIAGRMVVGDQDGRGTGMAKSGGEDFTGRERTTGDAAGADHDFTEQPVTTVEEQDDGLLVFEMGHTRSEDGCRVGRTGDLGTFGGERARGAATELESGDDLGGFGRTDVRDGREVAFGRARQTGGTADCGEHPSREREHSFAPTRVED
jgi:hypothetical protein